MSVHEFLVDVVNADNWLDESGRMVYEVFGIQMMILPGITLKEIEEIVYM